MKLTSLPLEFQQAIPVLEKIQRAGFLAYFVGGSVRDSLLKRPIHDVDIATSATPTEIKGIFQRTVDIGIEHGTVLVLQGDLALEVTTFRTEKDYQDYRHPSEVSFVRKLDEDLKRRDFTINALAMDKTGEIIDLFNGVADLENRVIRAVGDPRERFNEDALRILRAFRFASVLGFEVEAETLKAISVTQHLLPKISVERIEMEFSKLLTGNNRTSAIEQMLDLELEQTFPVDLKAGLVGLTKINQPLDLAVAWTLLCYFNHREGDKARQFLRAFKHSNQFVKMITTYLAGISYRKTNRWDIDSVYHYGLENCLVIEKIGSYLDFADYSENIREIYRKLPIYDKTDLKINGKDILLVLNQKQGKWLGQLLNELENKVLHGEILNNQASLVEYVKQVINKIK